MQLRRMLMSLTAVCLLLGTVSTDAATVGIQTSGTQRVITNDTISQTAEGFTIQKVQGPDALEKAALTDPALIAENLTITKSDGSKVKATKDDVKIYYANEGALVIYVVPTGFENAGAQFKQIIRTAQAGSTAALVYFTLVTDEIIGDPAATLSVTKVEVTGDAGPNATTLDLLALIKAYDSLDNEVTALPTRVDKKVTKTGYTLSYYVPAGYTNAGELFLVDIKKAEDMPLVKEMLVKGKLSVSDISKKAVISCLQVLDNKGKVVKVNESDIQTIALNSTVMVIYTIPEGYTNAGKAFTEEVPVIDAIIQPDENSSLSVKNLIPRRKLVESKLAEDYILENLTILDTKGNAVTTKPLALTWDVKASTVEVRYFVPKGYKNVGTELTCTFDLDEVSGKEVEEIEGHPSYISISKDWNGRRLIRQLPEEVELILENGKSKIVTADWSDVSDPKKSNNKYYVIAEMEVPSGYKNAGEDLECEIELRNYKEWLDYNNKQDAVENNIIYTDDKPATGNNSQAQGNLQALFDSVNGIISNMGDSTVTQMQPIGSTDVTTNSGFPEVPATGYATFNYTTHMVTCDKYSTQQKVKVTPVLKPTTTYVPLRYLMDYCGLPYDSVKWNASTKTCTITSPKDGSIIKLIANNKTEPVHLAYNRVYLSYNKLVELKSALNIYSVELDRNAKTLSIMYMK